MERSNIMRVFKDYNETLFLANMFIVLLAVFNAMTGLFFVRVDNDINSPTYGKMAELMSLDAYGIIMLLSAAFLIISAFQMGRLKYLSMLVGGFIGTLIIGLYASASTLGAANLMLPMRYSLMVGGLLIIAVVGGVGLWKSRHKQGSSRN